MMVSNKAGIEIDQIVKLLLLVISFLVILSVVFFVIPGELGNQSDKVSGAFSPLTLT